jgi:hypothetical protein
MGDEVPTARQRYRIVKAALPATVSQLDVVASIGSRSRLRHAAAAAVAGASFYV